MRAFVFINKDVPNLPIFGKAGHVGWGFEIEKGNYCFGATEGNGNYNIPPGQDNFLVIHKGLEKQMLGFMKTGPLRFKFESYKSIFIDHVDINAGLKMAHDSKNWGYTGLQNNCMDHTFKIIKAYACGNDNVLPWPSTHWKPIDFFNDIKVPEMTL